MPAKPDNPQYSKVPCGILAGLILLCGLFLFFGGLGVSVYNWPRAAGETGELVAGQETSPLPTPTPAGDLSVPATPTVTGADEAGPTAVPTPDSAGLPDTVAERYSALLVLEGSVYLLEFLVQEVENGVITQAEAIDYLGGVEQALAVISPILAQELAPETDPQLVQAWNEALNAFSVAKELTDIWVEGNISAAEMQVALQPLRTKIDDSLALVEAAIRAEYGLSLGELRQGQIEAVRELFLASVRDFVARLDANRSAGALVVPVEFDDADLPLSDTLTTGAAGRYAARIQDLLTNFEEAQKSLDELSKLDSQPLVGNSQEQIQFTIASIRATSQLIKRIELQTRMSQTRQGLLVALLDCETAVLYLQAGLDEAGLFTIGQGFLQGCIDKLEQPKAELSAFVASNQTPDGTAAPAVVVVSPGCAVGCETAQPGCYIKADLDDSGQRTYYLPGMADYAAIVLNASQGDRWFCTLSEAVQNGWQQPS